MQIFFVNFSGQTAQSEWCGSDNCQFQLDYRTIRLGFARIYNSRRCWFMAKITKLNTPRKNVEGKRKISNKFLLPFFSPVRREKCSKIEHFSCGFAVADFLWSAARQTILIGQTWKEQSGESRKWVYFVINKSTNWILLSATWQTAKSYIWIYYHFYHFDEQIWLAIPHLPNATCYLNNSFFRPKQQTTKLRTLFGTSLPFPLFFFSQQT